MRSDPIVGQRPASTFPPGFAVVTQYIPTRFEPACGTFLALALLACTGCGESLTSAEPPSAAAPLGATTIPGVTPAVESKPASTANVKPKGVDEGAIHRPTPRPDRVILTWVGDPSRSQAVTWRTDTSVVVGLAEIAAAGDNGQFVRRSRQLKARTTPHKSDLSVAHYHSVEFGALVPSTKYAYRVGDGTNWTEWFHFTTASDQPEPFSFIYFGDAQTELKSLWSRVIREAFADAPRARFLLHAGDLVNNSTKDAEWGEWFQAGGWLNAMIPSVPSPGNHEYQNAGLALKASLTDFWRVQFTLPENGPSGLAESAYYMDYQGVRIISLNSNELQAEQAQWLDALLSHNPCRWTIITFHHPIYSAARARDNAKLRSQWQPILDKYRVDLVLQGHDHTYARSGMVDGQTSSATTKNEPAGVTKQSESAGTVYVVSVSGPKMYDLDRPSRPQFQRIAEDVQLFQIITIEGDELHFQARTATGTPYDGFTLKKRPGRSNELIEQIPSVPQRLRPQRPPAIPAPALPEGGQ